MTNEQKRKLITDLQSKGLKLLDPDTGRKGGAGPSDHKAVTIDGTTVMIPVHTDIAARSVYTVNINDGAYLQENGKAIAWNYSIKYMARSHLPRLNQPKPLPRLDSDQIINSPS